MSVLGGVLNSASWLELWPQRNLLKLILLALFAVIVETEKFVVGISCPANSLIDVCDGGKMPYIFLSLVCCLFRFC